MLERLEARRLLAAVTMFADKMKVQQAPDGSLSIQGGSPGKQMNVSVIENGITQTSDGPGIGLGNELVHNNTTNQEAVFRNVNTAKPILISGTNGADTIHFDGTSTYANIAGGNGDDSIDILERGNGGSVVNGGAGNDTIAVVFSNHATVTAGDGDDVIVVQSSFYQDGTSLYGALAAGNNVVVNGGDGNDTITVYQGNATVDGGKNNDTLIQYSSFGASVAFTNVEQVTLL